MFRRLLACALCMVVGAVAAHAAMTTVQLQDSLGNPIVDTDVLAVINGEKTILPGNSTGTFVLDIEEGDLVYFETLDPDDGDEKIGVIDPDEDDGDGVIVVMHGAPPAACDMPDALVLGDLTPFSTVGAGGSPEIFFCGAPFSTTTDTIWFSVIGTGNRMFASTCEMATFDTMLGVFCEDCEDLTCVAGNDDGDGCAGFTSYVEWDAEPGATYRIAVSGFSGATGSGDLRVDDTGDPNDGTPIECGVRGGCCFDNIYVDDHTVGSICQVLTQDDCESEGGTYQGDGTDCTPNPNGDTCDFVDTPGTPIPESGNGSIVETIEVTDSFLISDVDVDFVTDHTFTSDLDILLTHPDGTPVNLALGTDDICSSESTADVIFDDDGAGFTCPGFGLQATGSGPPASPLAALNGKDAIGMWTLTVTDTVGGDTGSLLQWSLHFDKGDPPCAGACCTDGPGTESDCIETSQALCEAEGGLFVGGSCDDIEECTTLLVEFDSISAVQLTDGVSIRWVTSLETDTVGFRVLRRDAGRQKSLTAVGGLVHSAGFGLRGASYEVFDTDGENAIEYFVVDYDVFGKATQHGPIRVQRGPRVRAGATAIGMIDE